VQEKPGAKGLMVKHNASPAFAVTPQRWIVKRAFAWPGASRRLWGTHPGRLPNTSLQSMHLTFLSLF
jgi:hypothetical protein